MASSEKNRIVVLSVFIIALIVFSILYRPFDPLSLSRAAHRNNVEVQGE